METFQKFIEQKLLFEADPPASPGGPAGAGAPPPGTAPSGPPGGPGGISAPISLPSGGGPPMGLGGPPMGGGPSPGGDSQSGSLKLKAYNVWDVLEKILK